MVCYFRASWISHKSLMLPKVSSATAVNQVSSTSTCPVHPEPVNVLEAHLPTEQDSVFSCYGPKCDAILDERLMASATQGTKYGGE